MNCDVIKRTTYARSEHSEMKLLKVLLNLCCETGHNVFLITGVLSFQSVWGLCNFVDVFRKLLKGCVHFELLSDAQRAWSSTALLSAASNKAQDCNELSQPSLFKTFPISHVSCHFDHSALGNMLAYLIYKRCFLFVFIKS